MTKWLGTQIHCRNSVSIPLIESSWATTNSGTLPEFSAVMYCDYLSWDRDVLPGRARASTFQSAPSLPQWIARRTHGPPSSKIVARVAGRQTACQEFLQSTELDLGLCQQRQQPPKSEAQLESWRLCTWTRREQRECMLFGSYLRTIHSQLGPAPQMECC